MRVRLLRSTTIKQISDRDQSIKNQDSIVNNDITIRLILFVHLQLKTELYSLDGVEIVALYLPSAMTMNKKQQHRQRRTSLSRSYRRWNIQHHNYLVLTILILSIYLSSTIRSINSTTHHIFCYAEDINYDNDDFKYTSYPTKSPTHFPTKYRDDFYEVQTDDYSVETQTVHIYYSSISDVMLCLLCTFFWVLWLVGTIFPTKIQHLYKSEGIVVLGDVIESYATNGEEAPLIRSAMDHDIYGDENIVLDSPIHSGNEDSDPDMAMGDTFDELKAIPQYHAIVCYVVPGPIARGKRRVMTNKASSRMDSRENPLSNYYLQNDEKMREKTLHSPQDHNASQLSMQHVTNSMQAIRGGTPPRHPGLHRVAQLTPTGSTIQNDLNPTVDGMRSRKLSMIKNESKTADVKSFDTGRIKGRHISAHEDIKKMGYYKYNRHDISDYSPYPNNEYWDDDGYEDPERIGNFFSTIGLSKIFSPYKSKPKEADSPPVRVKKRFETNELLQQGSKNVEIIVLPGNPGSGILKNDFEMEEDYMLHGASTELDKDENSTDMMNGGNNGQMGDMTAGIVGMILASVSVIGAVHGALTLPYQEREGEFE